MLYYSTLGPTVIIILLQPVYSTLTLLFYPSLVVRLLQPFVMPELSGVRYDSAESICSSDEEEEEEELIANPS